MSGGDLFTQRKHQVFHFKDLPFPPSVNHLRMPRIVGKRIIPIKTTQYRNYEKQMNAALFAQVSKLPEIPLALYAYFYQPNEYWFTKAGKAQRKDIDNHAKALLDSFCKTIGLDDKWFFEVHLFKCIGETHVHITITDLLQTETLK